MATSGSVNFSVTRNEIITEALEILQVPGIGDAPGAEHITSCSRTLNMMIKHWQVKEIFLWKSQDVYLFLTLNAQSYDIGPSGDHATLSFTKTEVSTAASSGASEVLVDSITGISDTYKIGIELDGGDLQWTTVNGAPSGSTVTLDDVLTDDVSVDANVYIYQTIAERPLYITKALLHRDSGAEIPVDVVSRNQYKDISTKTSTGPVNQVHYDPQMTNGKLYTWPTASTVKDYLVLTCRMPIEDFDASTNNPDFPQEWLLPLAYNLALYVDPKYGNNMSVDAKATALQLLEEVSDFDKDFGSVFFEYEG